MGRLRLGYTKSRAGCQRCKQRRVKCDEHRPCKACIRHGLECSLSAVSASPEGSSTSPVPLPPSQDVSAVDDFGQLPNSSTTPAAQTPRGTSQPPEWLASEPAATSSNVSTLTLAEPPLPTIPDPFPYFAKFTPHNNAEDDTATWVSDLELLHHWTTTTCKSVGKAYDLEISQCELPRQAFTHHFLLHQILAITAFHQAYLQPQHRQSYSLKASHHQSLAIQGIRFALSNISADNCHALFASSTLLYIGAMASSGPKEGKPVKLDNLIDVFLLSKGIYSVLISSEQHIRSGPLHELFEPRPSGEPQPVLERLLVQLEKLAARVLEEMNASSDADDSVRDRDVIMREIDRLVGAIQYSIEAAPSPVHQVVGAWPLLMGEDFIALLRQRCQPALAVLSVHCVIMHATEDEYWFTRGWGLCIIQDISQTMAPPWNQDAAWALGWITGRAAVQ
ncbi:hypothetical protein B0H66DRAFT_181181 [Apodospora peruviana]|uniref:Zn(2)-C6 fungal-type domain-containing protein n=1 Tax=Apodospora peruviana TaxID=516989 RepID=A0AAE0IB10_9PEZI|nr:hypothetical protein B0H66DRAFT_181181 [Apodospora peruviana]